MTPCYCTNPTPRLDSTTGELDCVDCGETITTRHASTNFPNIPGVIFTKADGGEGSGLYQAEGTVEHKGKQLPFYFRARDAITLHVAAEEDGNAVQVGFGTGHAGWELFSAVAGHDVDHERAGQFLRVAFTYFPAAFEKMGAYDMSRSESSWWADLATVMDDECLRGGPAGATDSADD